jgi:hypothetical protein
MDSNGEHAQAAADWLFRGEQRSDGSWISKVTLLSESKADIFPQELQNKHFRHEPNLVFQSASQDGIHETAAEFNYGLRPGQYLFFSTGESIQVNLNQPLLLPVHEACLQIAKHVIRVRTVNRVVNPSCEEVTSMRRLWEVLESRYLETVRGIRSRKLPTRLKAPHNYHMPFLLGGVGWKEEADSDVLEVHTTPEVQSMSLDSMLMRY